jgi:hypothetical protein
MRPDMVGNGQRTGIGPGPPATSPSLQPQRRVEVEGCGGAQPVGSHGVRRIGWHSVPLSANGEASTHLWGVQGRAGEGCVELAQPSPAPLRGRKRATPERPPTSVDRTQPRTSWFRLRSGWPDRMGGCVSVWPCPSVGVDYRRPADAGGPPSKGTYRTHCPGNPGLVESIAALQQRGAAQDRGGARSAGTRRPLDHNRSPGAGNDRTTPESRESEWRDRPRARRKRVGPNTGGGARTREVHT